MVLLPVPLTNPITQLNLPPGFRFHPTDEELMVQYLHPKVAGNDFQLLVIRDVDLYKFDPWDLPSMAMFGEKEWYFFSPRDRKYPNGTRPNRVAGSGYWKATGTDKAIMSANRTLGIKKALVFYTGKAPKGCKTGWIMHEYRLPESPTKDKPSSRLDDWVLCRIYKKISNNENTSFDGPRNANSPTISSASKFLNFPTNDSMKTSDEEFQKFDSEDNGWMSVRAFPYPDPINNNNDPPISTLVDPTLNTQMKFVELLESSDDLFAINPTQKSRLGYKPWK